MDKKKKNPKLNYLSPALYQKMKSIRLRQPVLNILLDGEGLFLRIKLPTFDKSFGGHSRSTWRLASRL